MAEARKQISFQHAGLGTILKQNSLAVPPNQREYSWTESEVTKLFQDFARHVLDDSDYFLGTIVTIPGADGTLEVVDGQQRLATTAILLAAIRDLLERIDEKVLVESINNEFLTGIDRVQRVRKAKLRLNVDDNEQFANIVGGDASDLAPADLSGSHKLLAEAYEEAKKHVGNIVSPVDLKDQADVLNRWVSFVEHNAQVILLKVSDGSDAFRMFETLNDRGLRTSQADLIKNYLFGISGERLVEVQHRWSYMRGTLESLDDDGILINFLRHALIAQTGPLTEAEVYDKVQAIAKSEQSAVTLAGALETLAGVYVSIFNPEHERWNQHAASVRRSIEVLNLFNIRPLRPLLVAVAAKMDEKNATKSFEFLVSLGVRLMIASSTRSGSVEIPLAEAAHRVYIGEVTTADDLREYLSDLTPSDNEFAEAFKSARVSKAALARYFLRSLEMTAKGEPQPWFIPQDDQRVINLEHVLPRAPEDNWPSFTDDDVTLYSRRLGNMVLLQAKTNSDLRNAPFAKKKEMLGESPYELTLQIAECDDWTPETIADRQAKLADLAILTWPVKP